MIIRPVRPADNNALCRMERLVPQGTSIRIAEERHDFLFRAAQFPGSVLLVAENEKEGMLISVMGGAPVRVRIGGEERTGGFIFDFRANPEYPRGLQRGPYKLWRETERQLLEKGVEFMFGLVKDDNPSRSIYMRMGAEKKGERTFYTLPVFRRQSVPESVEIRAPETGRENYEEAARCFRDYDLWPLPSDGDVLRMQHQRCLKAEVACRSASLRIWDATIDFRRVVVFTPKIYEMLRRLTSPVAGFLPIPRIPRVGDRLRTWQLYDIHLPDGPRDLNPLIAAANNLAFAEGIDFLVASASSGEIELFGLKRKSIATFGYDLFVKPYVPLPNLSKRTYFDIRML